MLPCSEVTRLYASEELAHAPLLKRLRVRFHLVMCTHCSRYVKELRLIRAAARDEFRRMLPDSRRLAELELTIREQIRAESRDRERPPPG